MILSEDRRHCYEELQQALEQLQRTVAQDNLDRAALAIEYKKVQQFFGNQIMRAPSGELDASQPPPEQSYLTEIHKQLRLLGTDVTFLQVAKQPATAQTRQTAAAERLNTLIGYCGAVLKKNSGSERARPDAELITELKGN
ncbi:heterocyst frequency control protein PatD [Microcoleus sp. ARI1-B5]|uniref:heterocyst frequency control protein PatD n=1 Tax=unclassified Microcoleus TaxID=2642155 RepID=UPI002FD1B46C